MKAISRRLKSAVNGANCVYCLLLTRQKAASHMSIKDRTSVSAQGHRNKPSRHQNQKVVTATASVPLPFFLLSAGALHPLYLYFHSPLSLSLSLLYQGSETPWEALISSAHPEELMTSNVPVNAEKAEHPS